MTARPSSPTLLPLAALERAIVARLRASAEAHDLPRLTVGTYGGQLGEGLERAVTSFPALWVVLDEIRPVEVGACRLRLDVAFAVCCAARSLAGEAAGRQGRGTVVGAYRLLELVIESLSFWTPTADGVDGVALAGALTPLALGAIRPLVNDRAGEQQLASVYAVLLETSCDIEIADAPPSLAGAGLLWAGGAAADALEFAA